MPYVQLKVGGAKHIGSSRGDLAIRGFWEKQTEFIFDVPIMNTDSLSRIEQNKSVKGCLEAQEKEKKDKYLKPCID